MSEIEERLKAALAARADLVQEEDLAPLADATQDRRAWWHSPRHWLPLAAVAAIVVAIPLLASLVTTAPDPAEPGGRPERTADEPGMMLSQKTSLHGDVDGDGRNEPVVLRTLGVAARVTVRVREGAEAVWEAPLDLKRVSLADVVDVDGHGGEEVLVAAGSRPRRLVVLTLVAEGNGFAVLTDEIQRGVGPEGFRHNWWIDDDGLVSSVSAAPVTRGDWRYEVDVVRWEPRQGLTPVEVGRFCVRGARPTRLFASCDDVPTILPDEHGGL